MVGSSKVRGGGYICVPPSTPSAEAKKKLFRRGLSSK